MREQIADHVPMVRRASRAPDTTRQYTVRHSAEQPYIEEDEWGVSDDDALYSTRSRTSVRRYQEPVNESHLSRTRIREARPGKGFTLGTLLLWVGIVMCIGIMLSLLINSLLLPAFTNWHNSLLYGYPRITKAVANTGHGTGEYPLDQYIGINNNGVIEVIELPYGASDAKSSKVYVIVTLTGSSASLIPITSISFPDANGDGKPDLEVVVNGTVYILYNTGTSFKAAA
jgi:hypothetical protein